MLRPLGPRSLLQRRPRHRPGAVRSRRGGHGPACVSGPLVFQVPGTPTSSRTGARPPSRGRSWRSARRAGKGRRAPSDRPAGHRHGSAGSRRALCGRQTELALLLLTSLPSASRSVQTLRKPRPSSCKRGLIWEGKSQHRQLLTDSFSENGRSWKSLQFSSVSPRPAGGRAGALGPRVLGPLWTRVRHLPLQHVSSSPYRCLS